MRVGRNELCPCGSGKKYKLCCEGKSSRGISRGLMAVIAVIAVIAALGVYTAFANKPASRAATPTTNRQQPPGPAPAGKVWSPEHGHWHDAAPGATPGATTTTVPAQAPATTPRPQPPGQAPPGKVWSPEHGHWHDAPK